MKRVLLTLLVIPLLGFLGGCKDGSKGQTRDQLAATAEGCIGCHDARGEVPVADITHTADAHYIDLDPDGYGETSAAGYRELNVVITRVDVTAASVVIDFTVTDEAGNPIGNLQSSDGRFTIAELVGGIAGDADDWSGLIVNSVGQDSYERFSAGAFQNLTAGDYRYTSSFDPSGDLLGGETMRVAIQISADDLPDGRNGWCDFRANLITANDCVSSVALTRDIVQTATCNECHGVTSDTRLALHAGGRTDVEYCVTCHNEDVIDPDTGNSVDMKVLIHKIHRGANLTNLPYQIIGHEGSVHDYSHVQFTKDIDDCAVCHKGAGDDVDNWFEDPTMQACGSCHDHVDFPNGVNHFAQSNNTGCASCHRPGSPIGVETVHRGAERAAEAALYAGDDGFSIDAVRFDSSTDVLTVEYSVLKSGAPMNLVVAPEWAETAPGGASRLHISVAWDTSDYRNEAGGFTPAKVLDIDGLDLGGVVTELATGAYAVNPVLPPEASGTLTVTIDGHPAANIDGPAYDDRIAVANVFADINIDGGGAVIIPRRNIVDVAKCDACHDAQRQGISLHGNNRTNNITVCATCHNPDATDIERRPAGGIGTADGKVEESIDMKRMIHQIHSGADLANGIVIWGFGFPGTEHDFSSVRFIGNRKNCETCHNVGTYGATQAAATTPSTIDTGADVADPSDDLNISPIAAVCSSCHDDSAAMNHMTVHGASFMALEADIN